MNPVLLIKAPGPLDAWPFSTVRFPLELGMMGAHAAEAGFHCELFDFAAEAYDGAVFAQRVAAAAPAMAVVQFDTPAAPAAHEIARAVKQHSPHTFTVAAGVHASVLPDATLRQFQAFDAALCGEPDTVFADLCRAVDRGSAPTGLPGMALRAGAHIIPAPRAAVPDELDALPRPARTLRPPEKYSGTHPVRFMVRDARVCAAEVETIRGCPYDCTHCTANACAGGDTRFRSVSAVAAEIQDLVQEYGTNMIVFTDPVFVLHRPRVEALCEQLERLGVRWSCRAAPHLVDEALLAHMAAAGCCHVTFTIPSGDDDALLQVRAPFTAEQARAALCAARRVDIRTVEARVLIGSHAGETRARVRATADLVRETPVDILDARLAVPLPGSPLFRDLVRRSLILAHDWARFLPWGCEPCWRTEHFSPSDLVRLQVGIMRDFYAGRTRGLSRLRRLRSLAAWREESRFVNAHMQRLNTVTNAM